MVCARWLSFALVASLLLVTSARGQGLVTPLQDGTICGEPDVAGSLADVSYFASSAHCISLCAKTESECKKFVRKVLGCYRSFFSTAAGFSNKSCAEMEPAAVVRECKAGVKDATLGFNAEASDALDSGLSDCAGWAAACKIECTAP